MRWYVPGLPDDQAGVVRADAQRQTSVAGLGPPRAGDRPDHLLIQPPADLLELAIWAKAVDRLAHSGEGTGPRPSTRPRNAPDRPGAAPSWVSLVLIAALAFRLGGVPGDSGGVLGGPRRATLAIRPRLSRVGAGDRVRDFQRTALQIDVVHAGKQDRASMIKARSVALRR